MLPSQLASPIQGTGKIARFCLLAMNLMEYELGSGDAVGVVKLRLNCNCHRRTYFLASSFYLLIFRAQRFNDIDDALRAGKPGARSGYVARNEESAATRA